MKRNMLSRRRRSIMWRDIPASSASAVIP
jgi:hypothetical protein